MESTAKVILGSIAFAIFWVLAVFPAVPLLPIGRTAGSLLGASLMVIFQVITPDQSFSAIDLPILGLLFATMVISVYLERVNMFKYLAKFLSWKSRGGKDLLCRVCFVSAFSSALFTNDTCCIVLTEFVLKLANQNNLPPQPFLLALASSANIGSSSTPIGNPQNLVIAIRSKISFGKFLLGILPAMLVGTLVNVVILLCMFWKVLSVQKDEEKAVEIIAMENLNSHCFSPTRTSSPIEPGLSMNGEPGLSMNGDSENVETSEKRANPIGNNVQTEVSNGGVEDIRHSNTSNEMNGLRGLASLEPVGEKGVVARWKSFLWSKCVYIIIFGMLVSLLIGLNMSWTAITAALALVALDFKDAEPCLEKVSYSLLVFFCGMFITVDGFNKTGIPSAVWDFMEPYARINHTSGVAVLSLVILVLSNLASNVPTVLLLGARIAASATSDQETKAWLILAWVSTVAGNLSLLGSAANLIVCEQARRAEYFPYKLSFWTHLRFGFPSTLIITAIGLPLIRG